MRRFSIIIGTGIVSLILLADSGESGDTKSKGALPSGWKALNLSAKQKDDVYKVLGQFKTKIDVLAKQIVKLREEERHELLNLLTPEQKAQLIGEKKSDDKKPDDKKSDKKPDDKKSDDKKPDDKK